jgi:TRAP-type mannitol/chloroaromatic compound transport system permease large subunit
LRPALEMTVQITTMIFVILIGATLFSLVFRGLGGDETIHRSLSSLPGGPAGAVFIVMVAMFLLGFFLDFLEIVFVVVPVVAPVLLRMEGVDPVWLGVLMAVNLQTSFLTPPFGPTLFYLRGIAPRTVATMDIYRGVVPFVVLQILGLLLLWVFPGLATWLPRLLYG